MLCPTCKKKMTETPCTYVTFSGKRADCINYRCDECEFEFESRRGGRYVVFDGVIGVDLEMDKP